MADDNFANLFDIEIDETSADITAKPSRVAAKKRELEEVQSLEERLGRTFDRLKDAKRDPALKKVLRQNVRRLELLAIIADNVRQQLRDLSAIEELTAKRAKHSGGGTGVFELDDRIGIHERDIAHHQEEILSARAQFKDPRVVSAACPPSPVLAVRNKMELNLDELSVVTSRLDLGPSTLGSPKSSPAQRQGVPVAVAGTGTDAGTGASSSNGATAGSSEGAASSARRTLTAEEFVLHSQDGGPVPVTPKPTKDDGAAKPSPVVVTIPAANDDDAMRAFLLGTLPKHSSVTLDVERRRHTFGRSDFVVRDHASGRVLLIATRKAALGSVYRFYQANRAGGTGLAGDGDKGQLIAEMAAGMGKHTHIVTSMRPGSTSGGKGDREEQIALVHQKTDHSDLQEHEYGVSLTTVVPRPDLDAEAHDRVTGDIAGHFDRREYDLLAVLNNRRAVWVPSMNQLILSYHSTRITGAGISSKKNFQLSSRLAPAHVLLEFGKIGEDIFELNVQNPLSPLVALCSVLCVF